MSPALVLQYILPHRLLSWTVRQVTHSRIRWLKNLLIRRIVKAYDVNMADAAETDLDAAAYAHYPKLTPDEVKTLVVDDQWLATLDRAVHGEMDRVSQALARRVRELADRYDTPLPRLAERVEALEARVNAHLARMGFVWK